MKRFDTVAIVGVGLIGASIGLAPRRKNIAQQVVGIGRRQSSLRVARQRGAITSGTVHLDRGVADADLVVVCTPVASIVRLVRAVAESCPAEAPITDVGSTKGEIVEHLDGTLPGGARFVGSHPMAGSDRNGPQFAQVDLLQGRNVIITPTRRTRPDDRRTLKRFWTSLGAAVVEMSPTTHDRTVAMVSHLPHAVAAVLAAATPEKMLPQVASGWLDTTRVAAGDEQLWVEILLSNRDHVLNSLARFDKLVASLRKAIEDGNTGQVKKILRDGRRIRDAVGG